MANVELINSLDLQQFVDDQVGLLTLQDIREELLKPGRDPRAQFVMPRFRDDVTSLAHLQEGMVLEGVVSNVTNFGAFVDIGVHQDGLVHTARRRRKRATPPKPPAAPAPETVMAEKLRALQARFQNVERN